MPEFSLVTAVRAPIAAVFDAALDVELHTGSMRDHAEQAVAGVTRGRLGPGDTVTWRARHFGIRWRMTVRITEYDRPRRFVDEQVSGAFRSWRHEHLFTPDEGDPSVTLARDLVTFSSPGGPVGRLVDRLLLTEYLRRLVEARNRHLAATLDTGAPPTGDLTQR